MQFYLFVINQSDQDSIHFRAGICRVNGNFSNASFYHFHVFPIAHNQALLQASKPGDKAKSRSYYLPR